MNLCQAQGEGNESLRVKRWKMPQQDAAAAQQWVAQGGVSPVVAKVLAGRGLRMEDGAASPVGGELCFHDPFAMKDMDRAAARIARALEEGERIAVYGDYDCDGITATALLTSYLEAMGADVLPYIPDRELEGYGLNLGAVRRLAEDGVQLIVTVDNGISALEEVRYAASLGVDVVVTDHHQPREVLPQAAAVVDPARRDDSYPFPYLCGAGVAFKLICALEGDRDGQETLMQFGALLAVATVADVVRLTGENRSLVQVGLSQLQAGDHLGLWALMEEAGLDRRPVDSGMVAFGLAPRINAAGRVGKAREALELLLCEDEERARELAQKLEGYNTSRKQMVEAILQDIDRMVEQDPSPLLQRVILLAGKGWNHGVIGIAAAKMVERYAKPCILLSLEGGEARASARSVEGYSIIGAIMRCSGLLTRYGGHDQAAGFSLAEADVPAFTAQLLEDARLHYDQMPTEQLGIDAVLALPELTVENARSLAELEPYGEGNAVPVFALMGCTVEGVRPIGGGKHLRLRLGQRGRSVEALWFGMTEYDLPFAAGDVVDAAVELSVNRYNGTESASVRIRDLRLSGIQQDKWAAGCQYYEKYRRGEPLEGRILQHMTPKREDIAAVYRYLRQQPGGSWRHGCDLLWCRLAPANKALNYCRLRVCLDVLQELDLVEVRPGPQPQWTVNPQATKVELQSSQILKRLKAGED